MQITTGGVIHKESAWVHIFTSSLGMWVAQTKSAYGAWLKPRVGVSNQITNPPYVLLVVTKVASVHCTIIVWVRQQVNRTLVAQKHNYQGIIVIIPFINFKTNIGKWEWFFEPIEWFQHCIQHNYMKGKDVPKKPVANRKEPFIRFTNGIYHSELNYFNSWR